MTASRKRQLRKGHPYRNWEFTQSEDIVSAPPPCFNFSVCGKISETSKLGRNLCSGCASQIKGAEYPMKMPILNGALRRIDYELTMASVAPRV
jgi:hypothetical protein